MNCKNLTEEEMDELARKHSGLVRSVALRLARVYGEDPEDLIQIGYIGLIKAAERFDEERGLQFSTYAVPMITGEIRSQMRDQGAIKVSRGLKSDAAVVRRAENDFTAKHGFSPRITDLAEQTGLSPERITEALQAADAMKNFEDYENVDIVDVWKDSEEQNVSRMDLTAGIETLEKRQRQIIILRYYKDYTQQQVAELLGISQVQVCRIEKKTLSELAEKIKDVI